MWGEGWVVGRRRRRTASPSCFAPEARNAAIESVVPPTTWHPLGRLHRAAASSVTAPIAWPGMTTLGSRPCRMSPSCPCSIHVGYCKPRTSYLVGGRRQIGWEAATATAMAAQATEAQGWWAAAACPSLRALCQSEE